MKNSIAQLTKAEFRDLVESAVEQKLLEMLGDPDSGLELRKAVRTRLDRQRKAVEKGERGRSLDDVVSGLGLE